MRNHLENNFISKFDLLNSQEDPEEIIWSSDSSDYENRFNDVNSKISKHICSIKRKRVTNRCKISKHISQLDITFTESEQNNQNINKLSSVVARRKSTKLNCNSPLLKSAQRHFLPYNFNNTEKSPIILSGTKSCNYKEKSNSPVLSLKHITPINTPKVRKKLFSPNNELEKSRCKERSKSPILNLSQKSMSITSIDIKQSDNIISKNSLLRNILNKENKLNNIDDNIENLLKLKSTVPLIDKVKSYFDSHFSANTSQSASISECDTENDRNSSKSMEEIEIINSQPEKLEPIVKSESRNSVNSFSSFENDTQIGKKVKYKKDGLAFRLNMLKKKRNASTSLWLHERFLAANSSFILPSEDFLVFRITNVDLKFGCHLIKALDVNNEDFLIILNNMYVHNNNIERDGVLKVYKPYKILMVSDYKLVVNLCKYECVVMEVNK